MFGKLRKWLVNSVIAPLAYKVMPVGGLDGNSIILNTGYFWIVSARAQSSIATEYPGSFMVTACQLSHDKLVQRWEFTMASRVEFDQFLTKLGKTQGTNNICVLDNTADFNAVWGDLDKTLKP